MALQWVYDDEGGHWEDDGYDEGGGYNLFAQQSADYLNNQYAQPSGTQNTVDDNNGYNLFAKQATDYLNGQYTPPSANPSTSDSSASGGSLWNTVKGWFTKDGKLDVDALKLAAAGVGGIAGLAQNMLSSGSNGQRKIGYQGSIPKLQANRTRLPIDDTNRVPGSAGRRYFSDLTYSPVPKTPTTTPPATPPATPPDTFPRDPRWGNENSSDYGRDGASGDYASGGIAGLAAGGSTGEPRYLAGGTDGMADELHASIDDKQPAKLSHGEFVIPADVVGHLGNGNSEAGAKRLYEMMARIRKARTGNPEQGKRINPNKFLPS